MDENTVLLCASIFIALFFGYAAGVIHQFWVEIKLENKSPHKWVISNSTRRQYFTGKFDKDDNPIFDSVDKAKFYKDKETMQSMLDSFNENKVEPEFFATSFWLHEAVTNAVALAHIDGKPVESEQGKYSQGSY